MAAADDRRYRSVAILCAHKTYLLPSSTFVALTLVKLGKANHPGQHQAQHSSCGTRPYEGTIQRTHSPSNRYASHDFYASRERHLSLVGLPIRSSNHARLTSPTLRTQLHNLQVYTTPHSTHDRPDLGRYTPSAHRPMSARPAANAGFGSSHALRTSLALLARSYA